MATTGREESRCRDSAPGRSASRQPPITNPQGSRRELHSVGRICKLRGQSRISGGDAEMTEARTFQTNEEAFEYACEHLDCSLADGKPVLAIVLAVHGRMCTVKIANREDKSIPVGTLNELLARGDLQRVCFSTMLDDKVPQVEPGELVLYTTMPELAAAGKETVAGTVVARVVPHHTPKGGWQHRPADPRKEATRERSETPPAT